MTKISYSELLKELEKYTPPQLKGKIFTKEQDNFLRLARKKGMSMRVIREWWKDRAGWGTIARETIAKRLRELK